MQRITPRNLTRNGLFALMLGALSSGLAQANQDLREACYGDVELSEYLLAAITGDTAPNADYFNAAEQAELSALVNDAALSGSSVQDKIRVALEACANGTVLQVRNSTLINQ